MAIISKSKLNVHNSTHLQMNQTNKINICAVLNDFYLTMYAKYDCHIQGCFTKGWFVQDKLVNYETTLFGLFLCQSKSILSRAWFYSLFYWQWLERNAVPQFWISVSQHPNSGKASFNHVTIFSLIWCIQMHRH